MIRNNPIIRAALLTSALLVFVTYFTGCATFYIVQIGTADIDLDVRPHTAFLDSSANLVIEAEFVRYGLTGERSLGTRLFLLNAPGFANRVDRSYQNTAQNTRSKGQQIQIVAGNYQCICCSKSSDGRDIWHMYPYDLKARHNVSVSENIHPNNWTSYPYDPMIGFGIPIELDTQMYFVDITFHRSFWPPLGLKKRAPWAYPAIAILSPIALVIDIVTLPYQVATLLNHDN